LGEKNLAFCSVCSFDRRKHAWSDIIQSLSVVRAGLLFERLILAGDYTGSVRSDSVIRLMLELKVNQVMSLGDGMVRLLLVRRGLKTRIEPISQTEEQRMAQSIASQVQQAMGTAFPGAVIVGGAPSGPQWDARIDMQITEEEYQQLGRPGINDTIHMEIDKVTQ